MLKNKNKSAIIVDKLNEISVTYNIERKNIINQAQFLGYKPKVSSVSSTNVELFQLLPATRTSGVNGEYVPDERYCLILKPYTQLSSVSGVSFIVEESVDFSQDTLFSPRQISVYNRDNTGAPLFYLIKIFKIPILLKK